MAVPQARRPGAASDPQVPPPMTSPQSRPPQTAATFRARAELVLVPVMVSDKSGPVRGLTRDDFTLQDKDSELRIATFEEIKTTDAPVQRATVRGYYTNTVENASGPRRITIIALDLLHNPVLYQAAARQTMVQYLLKHLRPGTPIGLITLEGGILRVLHDITTDSDALLASLKNIKPQITNAYAARQSVCPVRTGASSGVFPARGGEGDEPEPDGAGDGQMENPGAVADFFNGCDQAAQFSRKVSVDLTLEALQVLARQLHGIPGRKSLIWLTSGFSINDSVAQAGPNAGRELSGPSTKLLRTLQLLSDANVAVYPVGAGGLLTFGRQLDNLDSMRLIAEATGGRVFINRNDGETAIEEAENDSSYYYVLGFYIDRAHAKEGWHSLQVKVRKSGVQVRARTGFLVEKLDRKGDPKSALDAEMAVAARSPVDYTGLPLAVKWTLDSPGAGSGRENGFEIDVGPGALTIDPEERNHLNFDISARARPTNEKDKPLPFARQVDGHLTPDGLRKAQQEGMAFTQLWALPPGDYLVRFVVRDNLSGRIGSVSAPLRVPALPGK